MAHRIITRLLGLAAFCFLAGPALGQAETLIRGDVTHGGYGGPELRLTTIDGEAALFVGGRGGWILNIQPEHTLVLGGGGYGLTTDVRAEGGAAEEEPLYLNIGYGGFILAYENRTNRLVHPSVEVLIGGGDAGYRMSDWEVLDEHDAFFVIEPGAHVILNVTTFFRMGAGLSYRYINGTNLEDFSDVDLSGFSGALLFKFGKF